MTGRKHLWRIWCKALGEKTGRDDREADRVAWVRTFFMVQLIITNGFIIANTIRHWG